MPDATWKESRILPVTLTPDEVRERGELLARELGVLAQLEAEQAAERKQMKEDLEEQSGKVSSLGRIVRERLEQRPVEVACQLNMALGFVEEIRIDTGEVLTTRPFREADKLRLQLSFPGAESPKPASDAGEPNP